MAAAARRSALFRDYAESHRHPVNRAIHLIAIPLIVFQVLAMLDWIRLGPLPGGLGELTLAHVAVLAAAAWYFWLEPRLGLALSLIFILLFPLARLTPRPLVVALGVAAWALQLLGHWRYERRSPAFLHNLAHLLIGPAYFVAPLVGVRR